MGDIVFADGEQTSISVDSASIPEKKMNNGGPVESPTDDTDNSEAGVDTNQGRSTDDTSISGDMPKSGNALVSPLDA